MFWSFALFFFLVVQVEQAASLLSRTPTNKRIQVRSRLLSGNNDFETILHNVTLPKPMGILMEEVEEGEAQGVIVVGMTGAAAQASKSNSIDLAIGDVLECIEENVDCTKLTFDQVMTILSNGPERMTLTFSRPKSHVAVCFAETGVTFSCSPGTPLKPLSKLARTSILYSCSQGDCTTCEQTLLDGKGGQRYVRPCVARVPKGSDRITIANSDSFLFGIAPLDYRQNQSKN